MKLCYYESPTRNFGDDLNAWIWDRLLPGWQGWDAGTTLVGVGTILSAARFPPNRPGRLLVAGSGAGYGAPPDVRTSAWDIRAVRGPRTARGLGLPEDLGIIDPAMMIADFPEYRGLPRSARPIFVPHVASVDRHDWAPACDGAGIDYVSPSGGYLDVIGRIARAPLVITESMHGAILADAFRIPWVPVAISWVFNAGKWMDWAESLGLAPEIPQMFPSLERLARMVPRRGASARATATAGAGAGGGAERPAMPARRPLRDRARLAAERPMLARRLRSLAASRPYLSDTADLQGKKDRYAEVLDGIRRDYGNG